MRIVVSPSWWIWPDDQNPWWIMITDHEKSGNDPWQCCGTRGQNLFNLEKYGWGPNAYLVTFWHSDALSATHCYLATLSRVTLYLSPLNELGVNSSVCWIYYTTHSACPVCITMLHLYSQLLPQAKLIIMPWPLFCGISNRWRWSHLITQLQSCSSQ